MINKTFFHNPDTSFNQLGELIYNNSLDILHKSQLSTGGTTASLPGTRYAGHIYPRDHAYATRAFMASGDFSAAKKALIYILKCEISKSAVMYQRYTKDGQNASYKPPQIDGNAQTLFSLAEFVSISKDKTLFYLYQAHIQKLIGGILDQTSHFALGSLVFSINGIIEYSPFESGFEIYTNAVCYRALKNISQIYKYAKDIDKAVELSDIADQIKAGIKNYLYYPEYQTYIPCLRKEPDVSYVILANLKSLLALTDFEVFKPTDKKIRSSLKYHLENTINKELGGYNRYHTLMDRHNFGNGPWPLVMLRLAQYYIKSNQKEKMDECFRWVMNIAKQNKDFFMGLPEHVSTKESFQNEYMAFKRINQTSPRPAKEKEYKIIQKSKTYKELGLAYAVNPLVWSHAQFILAWNERRNNP